MKITYTFIARKPPGKAKGSQVEKWYRKGKLTSVSKTRWTKHYRDEA